MNGQRSWCAPRREVHSNSNRVECPDDRPSEPPAPSIAPSRLVAAQHARHEPGALSVAVTTVISAGERVLSGAPANLVALPLARTAPTAWTVDQ